jgi:hypothetical protein
MRQSSASANDVRAVTAVGWWLLPHKQACIPHSLTNKSQLAFLHGVDAAATAQPNQHSQQVNA